MGTTPLAPIAVATRIPMKAPAVGASAVAAVSVVNATSDPMITGRRPTRSDSGPYTSVITP